mmetsp:Transcript_36450/g.67102  ORF Transcript_36450/g.67102 Transcript_36450/m.67102 type:complete len:625 (-) Transcript_36450:66-1940(-)
MMHALHAILLCLACSVYGRLFGDFTNSNERLSGDARVESMRRASSTNEATQANLVKLLALHLRMLSPAAAFSPTGAHLLQRIPSSVRSHPLISKTQCRLGRCPPAMVMDPKEAQRLLELKAAANRVKAKREQEAMQDAIRREDEMDEEDYRQEAEALRVAQQSIEEKGRIDWSTPGGTSSFSDPFDPAGGRSVVSSNNRILQRYQDQYEDERRTKRESEESSKKTIQRALEQAQVWSRKARFPEAVRVLEPVARLCSGSTALSGDVFAQLGMDYMAMDNVQKAEVYVRKLQSCAGGARNGRILSVLKIQIESNDIYEWDKKMNPDREAANIFEAFAENYADATGRGQVVRWKNPLRERVRSLPAAVQALRNASLTRKAGWEGIDDYETKELCQFAIDTLAKRPRALKLPLAGLLPIDTAVASQEKLQKTWLLALTMDGLGAMTGVEAQPVAANRKITWSTDASLLNGSAEVITIMGKYEMQKKEGVGLVSTKGVVNFSTFMRKDFPAKAFKMREEEVDMSINTTVEECKLVLGGVPLPILKPSMREKVIFLNSDLLVTFAAIDQFYYVYVPEGASDKEKLQDVPDVDWEKMPKMQEPDLSGRNDNPLSGVRNNNPLSTPWGFGG